MNQDKEGNLDKEVKLVNQAELVKQDHPDHKVHLVPLEQEVKEVNQV